MKSQSATNTKLLDYMFNMGITLSEGYNSKYIYDTSSIIFFFL